MADLYIDTDNVIEISGVTNAATGAVITTAAVVITLLDASDDSEIVGETWPLTLTHIAAGLYRATLKDTLTLAPCVLCKAQFSIDDGAGFHREWESLYNVVHGTFAASIFIDNTDHVIKVDGLWDDVNDAFINSSTDVEVTLKDTSDIDIAGQSWPFTLTYEAASDGVYEGTLSDTLDVTDGDVVKVLLTADNGAGFHREWRSILTVETGT